MERAIPVTTFTVGNIPIGDGRIFIIAEAGSNHDGSLEKAIQLIDAAKDSGADAVKFQSINLEELYVDPSKIDMIEFPESWYEILIDYCDEKEIIFMSSPTYLKAVDIMENFGVKAYKIASPQTFAFPQLIEKVARTKKPAIMSTGYCTLSETDRAIRLFASINQKLALLHCVSEYPCPYNKVNLKHIQTLQIIYHQPAGLSDHSIGIVIPLAASGLGSDIIEKHICLERDSPTGDRIVSLLPDEFARMVKYIRQIEIAWGCEVKPGITEIESKMRETMRMKTLDGIEFKRDINGEDAWEYYGRKFSR